MSIVKITPINEKSLCTAGETCHAQFSISNTSGQPLSCGVQIHSQDDIKNWIEVEGSIERKIEEGIDTTILVDISPPKDLLNENDSSRNYAFRLRVYNAKQPEDTVDSPTVSVTVKPAKIENSKPFPWWWVAVAVSVIVVIGIGIIWAFQGTSPNQQYRFVDAAQKSTFSFGSADKAIDGNTDGQFNNQSVTHTTGGGRESNPWWQGNLGKSREIGRVVLYNRTDCCGERLSNFYIFVSDEELKELSISEAQRKANRFFHNPGIAGAKVIWEAPEKTRGRYITVMIFTNVNPLSLAEVEVFSPGD